MTMGTGCTTSTSRKQKLNTTSSTEAELVGAHGVNCHLRKCYRGDS